MGLVLPELTKQAWNLLVISPPKNKLNMFDEVPIVHSHRVDWLILEAEALGVLGRLRLSLRREVPWRAK